jgi:hypothetical protein
VPAQAIEQLRQVVGDRVEAVTILGGDYAAARGFYSLRGGDAADLDITKLGGGGPIGALRPLGTSGLKWAPLLQGNLGWVKATNTFETGYLEGNRSVYDTFAAALGGGARLSFSDHASVGVVLSGMYGKTRNDFRAENDIGRAFESVASGRFVDWEVETWSIAPAAEFQYVWTRGVARLDFTSRYNFFHTESFRGSSPFIHVDGDSHTWENRVGVESPAGFSVFGTPLETGGFLSRIELSGGVADGLDTSYAYTANGRLVLDLTDRLWKTRWLGIGATYFRGTHFRGWSAGIDARFRL